MITASLAKNYSFLSGGGKLGEITRSFDWSNTSIGAPDQWPFSLRTSVSNLLRSKFPMFLWWGEEMIQFYNDAYRTSLGNSGKHPRAVGQQGRECWMEIWNIISPLLEQVKATGEAIWMEDLLVPIFRNGHIEDVYWTFSYSSVLDDDGNHGGILVTCTETTEKVNNLNQLAESQDQLHFAIEATELGTWDYNLSTKKFTTNARLKEWCGINFNDKVDWSAANKVIADKDRHRVIEALTEAMQFNSGGFINTEFAIEGDSIKSRTVVAKGKVYFGENGVAYRFSGTLQDVTEKEISLLKLKQSEQHLRNTILQAPVAMCILRGPDFFIETANERMFELWGRSKEELFEKFLFDALPEAMNQGYEELLKSVYHTGKSVSAYGSPVSLFRNGTLTMVYVNLLYAAYKESDGSISGILVVATDVTQQVVAQLKLEESNKEFQFVTDFLPQMIWATRADGYHYFFNKQWFDYTGLSYDQTKDTGWNEVFHPDDRERAWQLWRHSLDTGEPYEIEYRCRRFDGEYRWVLGRALPLRDESGQISKWFGTCTDVHDHKLAADLMEKRVEERTYDLSVANADLIKLNAELEQFTFISSHDLQEPLRKIILFAGMLKTEIYDTLTEASKVRLNKMMNAAYRMRESLKDVMDYVQLGDMQKLERVDLNKILATVYSDLELMILDKRAVITADQLPVIDAVPHQMHQLFYNLVINALKFSKKTEPCVIKISCARSSEERFGTFDHLDQTRPNAYIITVQDNGIGFGPEDEKKIFDMFQRLHSKDEYEGTGIGLAICRKVVLNHKGYITATGKINEGASIQIVIPLDKSDMQDLS